MKKKLLLFLAFNFFIFFFSLKANAQASACSGTISANSVATYGVGYTQIGNGTAGSIQICIATNTMDAACMGTADVLVLDDNGAGITATWSSATANSTCYTFATTTGYAYLAFQNDACGNTGNATISWTTLNACGVQVCTGTPPPCGGPVCTTCATACATCGFASAPTVATVTSTCPDYPFSPPLATGQTATRCHTFTATNTTVSFNVIISSNCGAGNVSAFSWTLQNASCGGVIQSGTISSLSFAGLTIGNQYTFCYTFTVPNPGPPTNNCTHTTHYPYFVGASPLPIELLSFDASYAGKDVNIAWTTATENNNDYFTIEKAADGANFEFVATVNGAGNSIHNVNYAIVDANPFPGLSYYRLKQTDYDGNFEYSGVVSVETAEEKDLFNIKPNPAESTTEVFYQCHTDEKVKLNVYDYNGRLVISKDVYCTKGQNTMELKLNEQPDGMYFITMATNSKVYKTKLIKKDN